MESNGIVSEVASWLSKADDLREKLAAERGALRKRLEEIDQLLAVMPGKPAQLMERREVSKVDLRSATWPQLVLAVIERNANGLSSAGVIRELNLDLREAGRPVEPTTIYSVLYRLDKAKKIRGQGVQGSRTYYPRGEAE